MMHLRNYVQSMCVFLMNIIISISTFCAFVIVNILCRLLAKHMHISACLSHRCSVCHC